MGESEQYFYKYTVSHHSECDGSYKLTTEIGLTFGKTFNEVCNKLIDYFGEETIEKIEIEIISDCDVLEESELMNFFNKTQ